MPRSMLSRPSHRAPPHSFPNCPSQTEQGCGCCRLMDGWEQVAHWCRCAVERAAGEGGQVEHGARIDAGRQASSAARVYRRACIVCHVMRMRNETNKCDTHIVSKSCAIAAWSCLCVPLIRLASPPPFPVPPIPDVSVLTRSDCHRVNPYWYMQR